MSNQNRSNLKSDFDDRNALRANAIIKMTVRPDAIIDDCVGQAQYIRYGCI